MAKTKTWLSRENRREKERERPKTETDKNKRNPSKRAYANSFVAGNKNQFIKQKLTKKYFFF